MNKKSKILLIVLGILVLILVGEIVYFKCFKYSHKESTSNSSVNNNIEENIISNDNDLNDDFNRENSNSDELGTQNTMFKWNFSEYMNCVTKTDNSCLINDKNGLNVSVNVTDDWKKFNIDINGHKFSPDFDEDLAYLVSDIKVYDDGYIGVIYSLQGESPLEGKLVILDSNANVVTDDTDINYSVKDNDVIIVNFNDNQVMFHNSPVIFASGGLKPLCFEMSKNNNYSYDDIVSELVYFDYVGNGKIKEVSREKHTLSDVLEAYTGSRTCE